MMSDAWRGTRWNVLPGTLALLLTSCSDPAAAPGDAAVDAAVDAPAVETGMGGRASALVGSDGARLVLDDGAELMVPAGALADPVILTMTRTDLPIPAGYAGHSALYRFAPSGLTFARAVTVRIPYEGDASRGGLYWSRPAGGYERLSAVDEGTAMRGFATHFSEGFVGTLLGDGGVEDVPDAASADAPAPVDAATDDRPDASIDASTDDAPDQGLVDATPPPDAVVGMDAPPDAAPPLDAGSDVPAPPVDVPVPPVDLGPPCVDCVAPRPVAPITGAHAPLRPQLRWALPAGGDAVRITLCRDRALTVGCVTQVATGTTAAVASDLAPGQWFWGLRGVRGGATGSAASAVWRLVVGNRPGSGRAWGGDFDFNGDGYADLHFVVPGLHADVRLSGPSGPTSPAIRFDPPFDATGFGNGSARGGDVDGDGYSDLVVGAPGSATAYVYRGGTNATIAPTPAWTLRGPGGSGFGQGLVATADLNGDGLADVVGASPGLGLLWFPSAAAGPGAYSRLTVSIQGCSFLGDANGDGRDDLLCTDRTATATTRSVYLGAAAGASAGAATPVESLPAGDVNGDGLADAVWNAALGFGVSGGAPRVVTIPDRLGPGGDLDGDGYSDLIDSVPMYGGFADLSFARGSATGLQPLTRQDRGCGTRVLAGPLLSDTNGDGRDEMLFNVTTTNGEVRLATNSALVERGSRGFDGYDSALTLALDDGLLSVSVTPLGDVNADGYADLAVVRGRPGAYPYLLRPDSRVAIVYGGASALRRAAVSPVMPEVDPMATLTAVAVGDLNGDRGTDLVLYTPGALRVYVTSGGALPETGTLIPVGGDIASVLALGDVNGDGRPDIAVNSYARGGLLLGTPTGFGAPITLTPTAPALYYDSLFPGGDLDRDGRADIVAWGRNASTLDLSFVLGAAGAPGAARWRVPGLRGFVSPMGDLNGDGYPDLMVDGGTNPARVLLGSAAGPVPLIGAAIPNYRPAPWDWNRDGLADAVLPTGNVLAIHPGNATTGVGATPLVACQFPSGCTPLPVGDVNGDGSADIAGACDPESVRVLLVGPHTVGPSPFGIPGSDATQVLR